MPASTPPAGSRPYGMARCLDCDWRRYTAPNHNRQALTAAARDHERVHGHDVLVSRSALPYPSQ